MKKLLFVIPFLIIACAPPPEDGVDGENGTSCSVEETEEGALITCDDGTSVVVSNGNDGADGVSGQGCMAARVSGGVQVACGDNIYFIPDGQDGNDGENGEGCSAVEVDGGVEITCADDTVFVSDGEDGIDGEDGASATDVFHDFVDMLDSKAIAALNIQIYNSSNAYVGRCSGTKTVDNFVVTAVHCLPPDGGYVALFSSTTLLNEVGEATQYFWHGSVERDIALIAPTWNSDGLAYPGILEEPSEVSNGDLVGLVSMPLSLIFDVQLSTGLVTDDVFDGASENWEDAFLADYAAAEGSSGGAVFDQAGNWIGIHAGGWNNSLELSIALPFE